MGTVVLTVSFWYPMGTFLGLPYKNGLWILGLWTHSSGLGFAQNGRLGSLFLRLVAVGLKGTSARARFSPRDPRRIDCAAGGQHENPRATGRGAGVRRSATTGNHLRWSGHVTRTKHRAAFDRANTARLRGLSAVQAHTPSYAVLRRPTPPSSSSSKLAEGRRPTVAGSPASRSTHTECFVRLHVASCPRTLPHRARLAGADEQLPARLLACFLAAVLRRGSRARYFLAPRSYFLLSRWLPSYFPAACLPLLALHRGGPPAHRPRGHTRPVVGVWPVACGLCGLCGRRATSESHARFAIRRRRAAQKSQSAL